MDLREFSIDPRERRISAVVVSARGARPRDLDAAAYARLAPAVDALWAQLPGRPERARVDVFGRRVELDGRAADYAALADPLAPVARLIRGELYVRSPDVVGVTPSDAGFWDPLFAADLGGWELGRASPPLADWFQGEDLTGLRALVPGCGRGHEARLLAGLGARVDAIDLAPTAIAQAIEATAPGLAIDFQVRDLFALPRVPTYDLVVEHTCFCAIDPARREEYVEVCADVLRPGGELVGVFYAHGRPGGPPFTTSADEVRARFGRRFEVLALAPALGSTLVRHGHELFGRLRRAS